jgi:hypothetical protein
MATMRDVFEVLNELKRDGVVEDYAVGGGMAFVFYVETIRTYDIDVFVFLPPQDGPIIQMTPLYADLKRRGFEPHREHVMIHGVPVQFLPSYNELVDDAIKTSQPIEYEGVEVRVVRPEHLIALALQTGGEIRRERVNLLTTATDVDEEVVRELLKRYEIAT